MVTYLSIVSPWTAKEDRRPGRGLSGAGGLRAGAGRAGG